MTVANFWRGKRVLVTGHSGFKGGWLTLWLNHLGAQVTGVALAPQGGPSLFEAARLASYCQSHFVDIRDVKALDPVVMRADPEIVFHLAAQPLVLESYVNPLLTWQTNVMGTLNLLEILRNRALPCSVIVVTSDKCYENLGHSKRPFVEQDALGGHDPYSSSKAAVEIAVSSWRRSFFSDMLGLATARAGNVIGGGDWAPDRLIPDLMRALQSGTTVALRRPDSVRPWQHVLEPLAGYLRLAEALAANPKGYSGAWNFGPDASAAMTVREVTERVAAAHPELRFAALDHAHVHEAFFLLLDSSKAKRRLDWTSRWSASVAIAKTLEWYAAVAREENAAVMCLRQIDTYASDASADPDATREFAHGA